MYIKEREKNSNGVGALLTFFENAMLRSRASRNLHFLSSLSGKGHGTFIDLRSIENATTRRLQGYTFSFENSHFCKHIEKLISTSRSYYYLRFIKGTQTLGKFLPVRFNDKKKRASESRGSCKGVLSLSQQTRLHALDSYRWISSARD